MRRLRYQVAMSLDGFIAGPAGEIDWIAGGEDFDFEALFAQFDTLVMGRKTYEELPAGGVSMYGDRRIVVVSRTLRPEEHPGVEIVGGDFVERVGAMKAEEGKDIWLFGGGELFRALMEAGLVDTVEPAVIPVMIGAGVKVVPGPDARYRLRLDGVRRYAGSMVYLEYGVER